MPPEIENLGRGEYGAVLERMLALHEAVQRGDTVGRVLFVEHDPVYTAGRATPTADLAPNVIRVSRGGRITYHGPGQLVVYPILRLPERDVGAWLRRLETFGMRVAAAFGLEAEPSVDGTGVFVAGRKIASIGVAVKRWVNLHGIAINVAMDLAPWFAVRPCGRAPETMGDLSQAAGRPIALIEAVQAAEAAVSVLWTPPARL